MEREPPFLEAEWRHLALFNFEVPSELLEPRVPAGTTLDTWEGKTLLSVVGFMFLDTRIAGISVPFHASFEEVNLRYYVKREVGDEVRRAVSFIKEFVPKPAVSVLARLLYNEPYSTVRMDHEHLVVDEEAASARSLMYSWRKGGRESRMEFTFDDSLEEMTPGSEEEFVAEHYWGYTRQRDGGTLEYEVEHPPWRVARARDARFVCDVTKVYGEEFVHALSGEPSSVFYAEGSAVKVYPGVRIEL
jgi:uncharacterized protein YqjF (DUF2071 family)